MSTTETCSSGIGDCACCKGLLRLLSPTADVNVVVGDLIPAS